MLAQPEITLSQDNMRNYRGITVEDALTTGDRPAGHRTSLTLRSLQTASDNGVEAQKRPEGGLEGEQNTRPHVRGRTNKMPSGRHSDSYSDVSPCAPP